MRRFDKRPLPALWLMAVIVCPSGLVFAQSSPVPAPDPTQTPVATDSIPKPAATTSTTLPKTPPSFEQVGDALMAHQRYQAAIEAYKKAPTNDPIVWNKLGIAYQLMFNLTDAMHCYKTSYKLNPKTQPSLTISVRSTMP